MVEQQFSLGAVWRKALRRAAGHKDLGSVRCTWQHQQQQLSAADSMGPAQLHQASSMPGVALPAGQSWCSCLWYLPQGLSLSMPFNIPQHAYPNTYLNAAAWNAALCVVY
jgi:hypothetical protein